jgi:hypothetical protein
MPYISPVAFRLILMFKKYLNILNFTHNFNFFVIIFHTIKNLLQVISCSIDPSTRQSLLVQNIVKIWQLEYRWWYCERRWLGDPMRHNICLLFSRKWLFKQFQIIDWVLYWFVCTLFPNFLCINNGSSGYFTFL